jgi:hypothetical protein
VIGRGRRDLGRLESLSWDGLTSENAIHWYLTFADNTSVLQYSAQSIYVSGGTVVEKQS